jgi:hypothetical protein
MTTLLLPVLAAYSFMGKSINHSLLGNGLFL